jgi:polyhydroxyalkanoate synthesis regulator phasin
MEPLTILTIGQGVAGYFQAENEAEWTEARYQQNRVNAAAARDLKIQGLNARMIQESEIAAEKKLALSIEAMKKRERAKVAAGEAGVSGSSVDNLVNEYDKQKLRGFSAINANVENLEKQIQLQKQGSSAEALNRINSLPRGMKPNLLFHAVSTAADKVDPYAATFLAAGSVSSIFGSGQAVYAVQDAPWGMADDE